VLVRREQLGRVACRDLADRHRGVGQ
jgi:hypothetical protein